MNKTVFLFIATLVGIICILYAAQNSCRKYSCLFFEDKQKFREIENIEDSTNGYKGTLTKGNIRVRLEAYSAPSQEVSERFTQTKVMQLQGLFENIRSPYPGALSNEIICEDRFKPIIKDININGIKTKTITGYLNERLQYGSCVESQLTYTGKTAILYCKNQKKWYLFEIITKKSDVNFDPETTHLIQSLKCQKSF